ncbi:hypothetical protein HQQ81_21215 [Microbacteriaceae bacterium VKM Ac-2854]|nr:hypothetical protein [Microbacteriaceae bacterium VKM Ac-2854]
MPNAVTTLTFAVAGGAGGSATYWDHAPVGRGGDGALVNGTLAVTPGQVLTLIVGQGGMGEDNIAGDVDGASGVAPGRAGGGGYGDGGSTLWSGGPNAFYDSFAGGSGGGGSAILLGGSPLVIAGGGGGSGAWNGRDIPTSPGYGKPPQNGGSGNANGTANGSDGNNSELAAGGWFPPTWTVSAGHGAIGATPGVGGSTGTGSGGTTTLLPGLAATGQNGAAGVSAARGGRALVSGAGGGGYAGGGSGGRTDTASVPSTTIPWAMAGAAGGAGSSFLSPAAGGTFTQAGNSPTAPLVRNPGWITLSWTCE